MSKRKRKAKKRRSRAKRADPAQRAVPVQASSKDATEKSEISGSAVAGEESADAGDESADAGDESAGAGDESADAGDESAGAGDESAGAGEESADAGKESADAGKESADAGKESADAGEESADAGEESADADMALGQESAPDEDTTPDPSPAPAPDPEPDSGEWTPTPAPPDRKQRPSWAQRRLAKRIANEPPPWPRWSFWKGAIAGGLLVIPLIGLAIALLARIGLGNDHASLSRIVGLAFIFAGVPAVFSGAGIARYCARRSTDTGQKDVRRAVKSGSLAGAIAGAGLIIIAAMPVGDPPTTTAGWIAVALVGALAGALGGAAIGAWAAAGSVETDTGTLTK